MSDSGTYRTPCSLSQANRKYRSSEWHTSYMLRHQPYHPSLSPTLICHEPTKWRCIGVTLDRHLAFKKHVSALAQSCNYHNQAIRHICHLLTTQLAQMLACSLILSRLDYYNAVLHGIRSGNIQKLQHVQNSAAWIVLQVPRRSLTKPLLRQLHWLPVQHRITYKLAVAMHKVHIIDLRIWQLLTMLMPAYLSRHIKLCDSVQTLCFTVTTRLSEPLASTAFVMRAFHCSAPATWNSLPRTVTDNDSLGTFKSRLKTFLFSLAFNWHWHYCRQHLWSHDQWRYTNLLLLLLLLLLTFYLMLP